MQKKLIWGSVALVLAFLFRGKLLEMAPWQKEGFSLLALLVALIGGVFVGVFSYGLVVTMKLRTVTAIGNLVIFSSIFSQYLGHWLGSFAVFSPFWGGVIAGVFEASVLYGALYGAKEVWKESSD